MARVLDVLDIKICSANIFLLSKALATYQRG